MQQIKVSNKNFKKWRNPFMEDNTLITDKKYIPSVHIYATGKGKETYIRYQWDYREKCDYVFMGIDKAKEIVKYLNLAIEDAERRKLLPVDEDE